MQQIFEEDCEHSGKPSWIPTQNLTGDLTDTGLKFTQPYVAVSAT